MQYSNKKPVQARDAAYLEDYVLGQGDDLSLLCVVMVKLHIIKCIQSWASLYQKYDNKIGSRKRKKMNEVFKGMA